MKYTFISLKSANDAIHKYEVTLKGDKLYHVKFGSKGASDYTKNNDVQRKERYIARHKTREDWNSSGVLTAGFWSRWVLWNKPNLLDSVNDTINKFNL